MKSSSISSVRHANHIDCTSHGPLNRYFRVHFPSKHRSPNYTVYSLRNKKREKLIDFRTAGHFRFCIHLPSPWSGPSRIHVADESNMPCISSTGIFPGAGIRCSSNIYPSSVLAWWTSLGYPFAAIICGWYQRKRTIVLKTHDNFADS